MSIKEELQRIKQLEEEIRQCEKNILNEFGVIDKKAWLTRQNINYPYDFKNGPVKEQEINLIEKEGFRLFSIKKLNTGLWFLSNFENIDI